MTGASPRSRMRLMAMAALVVTFVAGALVGVAFERVRTAAEPVQAAVGRGRMALQPRARTFARGSPVVERLHLSEEQQARIDSILSADRAKAEVMLRQIRPLLQARYDSTTAAIRAVLTPEQRQEFRRLRMERRRQLRRQLETGSRLRPPADGAMATPSASSAPPLRPAGGR